MTTCATADLTFMAIPTGQVFDSINCDGQHVTDSMHLDGEPVPEIMPATTAAEIDAAFTRLQPLLNGDVWIFGHATNTNGVFTMVGAERTDLLGQTCRDAVQIAEDELMLGIVPALYSCTPPELLPLGHDQATEFFDPASIGGEFFLRIENEALELKGADPAQPYNITYFVTGPGELDFLVDHDTSYRFQGRTKLP